MTTLEKYITEIMDSFRKVKGRGSCYCLYPLNPYFLIAQCIISYFEKHDDEKTVLVVVDSYNARKGIDEAISQLSDKKYNFKVISYTYIKMQYHYVYDFIILCNVENNYNLINKLYNESKFTLCIFTKNITDNEFIINVRKILPNLECTVNPSDARADNIYSPVEEYLMGVSLTDEDFDKYKEYSDFIAQSMKIFNDFSTLDKCRVGIPALNVSSIEFRYQIALQNGWREDLDTTIPVIKSIDDVYNPNALYDRACVTYNIINERKTLLLNNKNKLDKILEICNKYPDKRILIVSKQGQFAADITNYLNEHNISCVDYHDTIEDTIVSNEYGETILYKSGANKGKPRIFKAQAVSSINELMFNKKFINCISIKYSSNDKLNIPIDIVIITDSLNGNIIDIKSRFSYIKFKTNPTIVYRLFNYDTVEEKELNHYVPDNNITVIKEEKKVTYDEKNGNIIL